LRGEVFNIGCAQQTTVNDLLREMTRSLGTAEAVEPRYEPARPGDVRHSLADITQAETQLGYRPFVGVAEGLDRTLAWYRRFADYPGSKHHVT
jgi:nucleoside-diphosphate-sugar epimerase